MQLAEPNCWEPEALPHQYNTPRTQYEEVPSTWTIKARELNPAVGFGQLNRVWSASTIPLPQVNHKEGGPHAVMTLLLTP
jgi:hypothetical protein